MSVILNTRPSKEIDPKDKPHVGTQVTKDGRLYGDKRCMICGDWYTWTDVEPEYCFEASVVRKLRGSGKAQCQDWYEQMLVSQKIREDRVNERTLQVMSLLKKRGLLH